MTLADRLVVMNGGVIEQVGAPIEVYRRPATRFVASFIGSPPMNILRGRVEGLGLVSADSCGIRVSDMRERLASGTPVDIGIRPEDIQIARPGERGDASPRHRLRRGAWRDAAFSRQDRRDRVRGAGAHRPDPRPTRASSPSRSIRQACICSIRRQASAWDGPTIRQGAQRHSTPTTRCRRRLRCSRVSAPKPCKSRVSGNSELRFSQGMVPSLRPPECATWQTQPPSERQSWHAQCMVVASA